MKLINVLFLCPFFCYSIANGSDDSPITLSANNHLYTTRIDTYYFYDGEPVNFTCFRNSSEFIQMSIYNGKFIKHTRVQEVNAVQIYMKLSADTHDTQYVICTSWDQEKMLRLKPINPKDEKGLLRFVVNGLMLPAINIEDGNYHYDYIYYHNQRNYRAERLSIGIMKDKSQGDVYCSVIGTNVPPDIVTHPRSWARADVARWVAQLGGLPERFPMNGKALCLMTKEMFAARVPNKGHKLHYDFRRRLAKALALQELIEKMSAN